MQGFFSKHPAVWRIFDIMLPFLATLAALGVGAVMLMIFDANPVVAYGAMLEGALGSTNALADTLVKATPLLLVALGICIAFRGGVINIGGEGQLILGALASTLVGLTYPEMPGWLLIPLALFAGFFAGGLWGAIPGLLKAYFNVSEILSTIMMSAIAIQGMNYLLREPMIDPVQLESASRIPQTARLSAAFDLPRLVPTRLHLGTGLAIIAAFLVFIFLWRTVVGYRIRAVGLNPDASRYAGVNVRTHIVLAMLLSGALCGLAGAIQVYGLHHRMFTDGSATGFTGSAGFNGIVVALFGQLHPLGAIPASFLFGALLVGANKLQRVMQVPSSFVVALNGLVVIFVVSADYWRRRLARRREAEAVSEITAQSEAEVVS